MPQPTADERLVLIEEKMVHLERYVSELDSVVRDLSEENRTLRGELGKLRKLIEQQATNAAEGPRTLEDDRPPHY